MDVGSGWAAGAAWSLRDEDGRVADDGTIETFEPPRRHAIRWSNRLKPDYAAEGPALCTMEIEPLEGAVKLTVTHAIEHPQSRFIGAVSNGWPRILSNLKSLLETGSVVLA